MIRFTIAPSLRLSLAPVMFCASAAAAQFDAPRARLTENLRISGADDDLTRIGTVFVDAKGRIGIGQPQDLKALLYSADGKKLMSFGGRGDGPGEFRSIANAGWIGDTLWISDNAAQRISTFTSAGKHIRTYSLATVTVGPQLTSIPTTLADYTAFAMLPGGSVVASRRAPSPRPTIIVRISPDNQVDRVLLHHPMSAASVGVAGGRMSISVPLIYDAIDVVAPDGNRAAYIATQVSGPRGDVRLLVVNSRGDSVVRRTYPFAGVAVSRAEKDSIVADRIKKMQGTTNVQIMPGGQQTAAAPYAQTELDATATALRTALPSVHYPVTSGQLGIDNTVWLQLRSTGGPEQWVMLNDRGDPEMSIVLPPKTRIAQASRTTLWTVQLDNDDIQSVVRYAIAK